MKLSFNFVRFHHGNNSSCLFVLQEQLCVEFPVQEDLSGKLWVSLLITGAGLGLVAALLAVHS
jgi:hypothetical protein